VPVTIENPIINSPYDLIVSPGITIRDRGALAQ
jgi:hypothetical protein